MAVIKPFHGNLASYSSKGMSNVNQWSCTDKVPTLTLTPPRQCDCGSVTVLYVISYNALLLYIRMAFNYD
jgi:hypothetical protein